MTPRSTSGIILKVADHGESDKLVTFFSPILGRVTGIAKGAKRSKQRFVNKLEPFSRLQIMYRPSRSGGLIFILEAELESAYLKIRNQYPSYIGAMYLAELVLRFTRENDPEEELFTLLAWALSGMNSDVQPLKTVLLFHLRLLTTVGYEPELQRCSDCSTPVEPGKRFRLQPAGGALLCNNCGHGTGPSQQLSVQTLRFLAHGQQWDLQRLDRLKLPPLAIREALIALHRYSHHLLQQDIHSWKAVKEQLQRL